MSKKEAPEQFGGNEDALRSDTPLGSALANSRQHRMHELRIRGRWKFLVPFRSLRSLSPLTEGFVQTPRLSAGTKAPVMRLGILCKGSRG